MLTHSANFITYFMIVFYTRLFRLNFTEPSDFVTNFYIVLTELQNLENVYLLIEYKVFY